MYVAEFDADGDGLIDLTEFQNLAVEAARPARHHDQPDDDRSKDLPPPSLPSTCNALAFTELGFLGFLGVYATRYVRLWACARDVGAGKLKAN